MFSFCIYKHIIETQVPLKIYLPENLGSHVLNLLNSADPVVVALFDLMLNNKKQEE